MTLEKCPCCKGEAKLRQYRPFADHAAYQVQCAECGLTTKWFPTAELAAEHWNRRAEDGENTG